MRRKKIIPISLYALSEIFFSFFKWGKYSLAAICHICVSTGMASCLSSDIKQTQSATLGPTPYNEHKAVVQNRN